MVEGFKRVRVRHREGGGGGGVSVRMRTVVRSKAKGNMSPKNDAGIGQRMGRRKSKQSEVHRTFLSPNEVL